MCVGVGGGWVTFISGRVTSRKHDNDVIKISNTTVYLLQ